MKFSINYVKIFFLFISLLTSSIAFSQEDEKEKQKLEDNKYDLPYNAITTTPYTPPKGSLVYQNLNLLINTLSYGVNDRLSVSAGFSLFDEDLDIGRVAMTQIKYNFYRDETFALSVSNLNIYQITKSYHYELGIDESKLNITPIFFLNAAIKSGPNAFWTFGVGTYHTDEATRPIVTLGYQNRFSRKAAFIADLWLPFVNIDRSAGVLPIPAAGFRFYTKNGITFDLGFPFVGCKIPLIKSK